MSEQSLAVKQNTVTENDINQFILGSNVNKFLTPAQKQLCIQTAVAWNLNPLKREIHFVAYQGQEPKIVVGYDVYIKRADRTAKLDGWNVVIEGTGNAMKAVITIHRKDWSKPFVHEVYFEEAAQYKASGELNATWKKMPRFMLKKVAIGQGFRLCFPEEFGGLPYMAEEIGLDEVVNQQQMTEDAPATTQQPEVVTGEIVSASPDPRQFAEDELVDCEYPGCTNTQTGKFANICYTKFNRVFCGFHWSLAKKGELPNESEIPDPESLDDEFQSLIESVSQ